MSIPNDQFLTWLGEVQHANSSYVVHVNEFGKYAPNVLYVGRAMRTEPAAIGRFGNPFYERDHGRIGCIKLYVAYLMRKPKAELLELLLDVRIALDEGRKLACWCAPNVCHAHVLAGWARTLNLTDTMHELGSRVGATTGEGAPQDSPEGALLPTDSPPCTADSEPDSASDRREDTGPRFARSA